MWELSRLTSHRGNSVRRIFTYALAAIIAAFLWALLATTDTHATDAGWNGNDISYGQNTYKAKIADGTIPPGLAKGTAYYLYATAPDVLSGAGNAQIIYFTSTTPATATSAKYEVFVVNSDGSYGAKESGPTDLSMTPKAASSSSTNAAWNGVTLQFDGKTFSGSDGSARIADGTTPAGLAKGTQYYQNVGAPDIAGNGTAFIIYFSPAADTATATSATYATYSVSSDGNLGVKTGTSKTISVTPAASSPGSPGTAAASTTAATSCAIDGVGWIVCPVSNFLATGMDWIFEQLQAYMVYKPLTNTNNSLYQAWTYARSIANIAFVIAFIVIIYSQLTNAGINNYGIKKLLPRLIVAAVLVNISYWLCAIAVDLSNVTGDSVQKIFIALREQLTGQNPNDIGGWTSITGFVLAGGTAVAASAAGIGIAIASTGASPAAAALLLLPMLLALVLAILVALVVLAARQAVITLLIIVSPLAFVAYLLPNTDEWFTRWRKTFTTLLVFFPLFSLIFGGSQLAGFLIIQNTDQLNIILLGMFVQVAPIVLTPMLIKLSGSLVGRIAGMVNNPSKGLLDRTKKWSSEHADVQRKKNMSRTDPLRRRQVFRRAALSLDQRRRNREQDVKNYDQAADNRYHASSDYSARHTTAHSLETQKETIENALKLHLQQNINLSGTKLHLDNVKLDASKIALDRETSKSTAILEEYKTGSRTGMPTQLAAIANSMRDNSELVALNGLRAESAKNHFSENYTRALEQNTRTTDGQLLQTYAGGIQGIVGAQRALASAINTQSQAHHASVTNATTILSHGNYSDDTIGQVALGNSAGTGIVVTDDMREAAIVKIAGGQNAGAILNLMRDLEINTTPGNQDFRQAFADTLLTNGAKPKFAGAGILANTKQGIAPPPGKGRIDDFIAQTINANKVGSADLLVTHDRDYLEAIRDTLRNNTSGIGLDPAALAKIKSEIKKAKTKDLYSGKIGERIDVLNDIDSLL